MIKESRKTIKPTVIFRPKAGETTKDAILRLSSTLDRRDKINFQIVQTKTFLILQMASKEDQAKLMQHQEVNKDFFIDNKRENETRL